MSCISWNARGLGNPRAFRDLRRLVAERRPSLLFLCETKQSASQCQRWKCLLNFEGHFTVDPVGRRGGLMLLCNEPFDVSIKSFSQGHIECVIQHSLLTWRCTCFYGNPVTAYRYSSWELLRRLFSMNELAIFPWLIGGDFNEIMFEHEKQGGSLRAERQMSGFRDVIEDCGLAELLYVDKFTWYNKRLDGNLILERLDRIFGNKAWNSIYPFAVTTNIDFYGSDHRPILINLCLIESARLQKRAKRFYFEHKWYLEEDFPPFIHQSCQSCDAYLDLPNN